MARHLFCFVSSILLLMAVVSSASELDNGYIPKPENSVPDKKPKQQSNGNPVDSPTASFNIPIKPELKPKEPASSSSPGHKKPKYKHPHPIFKKPIPTPLPVHKKKPLYKKPIYIPKPIYVPIYKNPSNDTLAQAPAPAPSDDDDYSAYPPPSPTSPPPPPLTQSPTNSAPPPYKSLDYIPAPVF